MSKYGFSIAVAVWLAILTVLAGIGPIGRFPTLFGMLYVAGFGGMLLLVRLLPADWPERGALAAVLVVGVAGRLLFVSYPVGNDVYRYVWEGAVQNLGYNPYLLEPDSAALADAARLVMPHIWEHINHRDFSAAYPPFFMLVCRLLAAVKTDPQFFKLVFTAFDMATLVVLARLAALRGIHPRYLLLYAANPLVIVYIAGEGHLDALQTFWVCLAVYQVLKGRARSGYLALGLAVMTKYVAIVALPFLLTRQDRGRFWTLFLPFLCFLPYAQAGGKVLDALGRFGLQMHYNDSVTAVLRWLLGNAAAVPAAAVLLAGVCLVIYLVVHDRLQSTYLAIGAMVLFLPTLHPWYLCLIAPFMVFFPSPAWLYLQAAVCFTFPVLGVEFDRGVFQEVGLLKVFEFLPFYALLLFGRRLKTHLLPGPVYRPPERVDVIIPALDEARTLSRAIESVKTQPGLHSILVADGGSRDHTCRIAREAGAEVVQGPRGRGTQIAAAVGRAGADVVLVLHADSTLDPNCLQRILSVLGRHPQAVGGAVGMRFADRDRRSSLIAWLNNQRTRWCGIGFGDQAQFFRSAVVEKMGGFPAIELMEDVELSLRLKAQGRLVFLDRGVRVSARRWQGGGFWRNVGLVIGLFTRYLVQRRYCGGVPDDMDWYYRKYYG